MSSDSSPTQGYGAGPRILCPMFPEFAVNNLETIQQSFQRATPLRFGQSWRENPEPRFLPGTVRVGWRADMILAFAELTDEDIFSDSTGFNQQMWILGDTFEMFLRPDGQNAYCELHVTPNNHHLQLRYSATPIRRDAKAWELARVDEKLFRSQTWLSPEAKRWFVYAEISATLIADRPAPLAGSRWDFSFGRYDYSRDRGEPVISSTSNHAEPDFHRQHEWGVLCFEF
jgi:hypothetical protein